MIHNEFDYTNQAWLRDGRYQDCMHPSSMDCGCYGRKYEGLTVEQVAEVKSADAELSTEHAAIAVVTVHIAGLELPATVISEGFCKKVIRINDARPLARIGIWELPPRTIITVVDPSLPKPTQSWHHNNDWVVAGTRNRDITILQSWE